MAATEICIEVDQLIEAGTDHLANSLAFKGIRANSRTGVNNNASKARTARTAEGHVPRRWRSSISLATGPAT